MCRGVRDVAAVLHPRPADHAHRVVGAAARHLERLAERGDSEHPTSRGHDLTTTAACGRGVEHDDVRKCADRVQAHDRVAHARLAG